MTPPARRTGDPAPARLVDVAERRARLARRHRLAPSVRTDDVAAIADSVIGLHSSDPASVYLSVCARMVHPSIAAVDDALHDERSLVRIHGMRRTLWVHGHELARLAHATSGLPLVAAEHRRLSGLLAAAGIDDPERWIDDARVQVVEALHRLGPTSARRLGDELPDLRVPLELAVGKPYAGTQSAHTRVLLLLGFEGTIVRTRPVGTWIAGQYEWAAMDAWHAGGVVGADPAEAAAGLVDAWLHAFGPATTADIAWWTGWTKSTTAKALARAGAVAVDVALGPDPGAVEPGWLAADDVDAVAPTEPWVALLPGLDPTTMGWKHRSWYLDDGAAAQLFDRNGNGGPAIWADGMIVGGWVQRRDGRIATAWFDDVDVSVRAAVDDAVAELEALLGDVRFTVRFPAPMQKSLGA